MDLELLEDTSVKLNSFKNNQKIEMAKRRLPYRIFLSRIIGMEFLSHNYMEIVYAIRGTVKIKSKEGVCILSEGDFYIIEANKGHSIHCKTKDNIILFLQIDSEYLETNFGITKDMSFSNDIGNLKTKQNIINALGALLYMEKTNAQDGYEIYEEQLEELVNAIKPYFLVNIHKNCTNKKGTVEFIVYDIAEKYSCIVSEEDMSLEKIALEYNVSYAYLSRMFKKVTGVNFTRYYLKRKLDKVIDLLLNTDNTITEIAISSGFSDVKALNRDFRNMFGMAPTEFRNKYKYSKDNMRINEDILYNDYSVQKFIQKSKKSVSRENDKIFIQNKNYDINMNDNLGINEKVWGTFIDLDCIMDTGINNIGYFLEESNIKNLVIKFEFSEDGFFLATQKDSSIKLSKLEISNLVRVLDNNGVIPVVELDFISRNKNIFLKDSNAFYELCYSKMKIALDFISMLIGVSKLAKWKFELYIPEINKLIINKDVSKILFKHIDYFVSTLQERFGQNKYSWGLYIGEVEVTEKKESRAYLKKLKGLLQQPEFYKIDLFCHKERFENEAKLCFLGNDISCLIDEINEDLDSYSAEKKQKLICTFNYMANDAELSYEYNFFYYNLFLNLILSNIKKAELYISSCKVLNYDMKNKVNYHTLYDRIGMKMIPYYIFKFVEELKTKIIGLGDGYYITKDEEEIVILLYGSYRDCFKYIKNSTNRTDESIEREIILNINNINGRYKATECHVNYKHFSYYREFVENIDMEIMNEIEKMYLQSRIMPDMKIKILNVENSLKYFVKLKPLDICFIKLQKI